MSEQLETSHYRSLANDNDESLNSVTVDSTKTQTCFDKNKLEAATFLNLVIVIGLLIFAGVGVSFGLFLRKEFTYHQECVSCLSRGGGFAFNHSNGSCIELAANNSSSSSSSHRQNFNFNEIVYRSQFCGAPACGAPDMAIIDGVRPPPLWALLLATALGIVLSALVNALKLFFWRPLKKCMYDFHDDIDKLEAEIDSGPRVYGPNVTRQAVRKAYFVTRVVGSMEFWYFCLMYVIALAHLSYLVYFFHHHHHHSPAASSESSGWQKFLQIFGAWSASGTFMVVLLPITNNLTSMAVAQFFANLQLTAPDESVLKKASVGIILPWFFGVPLSYDMKRVALGLLLQFSPMLPCLLILVLPAAIIFIPVTVLFAVVYCLLVGIYARRRALVGNVAGVLLARLLGNFLWIWWLQMCTNSSIVFYDKGTWTGAIVRDWNARDANCWANELATEAQKFAWHLAGLLLS